MARRKRSKQRTLSKVENLARATELDDEQRAEIERERRHAELFFGIRLNTIPACLGAARVPEYFGAASAEIWLASFLESIRAGSVQLQPLE